MVDLFALSSTNSQCRLRLIPSKSGINPISREALRKPRGARRPANEFALLH